MELDELMYQLGYKIGEYQKLNKKFPTTVFLGEKEYALLMHFKGDNIDSSLAQALTTGQIEVIETKLVSVEVSHKEDLFKPFSLVNRLYSTEAQKATNGPKPTPSARPACEDS